MKRLILLYLTSKIGIVAVLRKEEVEGLITSLVIDFLGKDDKYYSLCIFYNATHIFCNGDYFMLTKDNSLEACIEQHLRVFNTKEEYLKGKWIISAPQCILRMLKDNLKVSGEKLFSLKKCGNFEIIKVQIIITDICGIIIYYTFQGRVQNPIFYNIFETNVYRLDYGLENDDLQTLFESAGLLNVEWE